MSTLTATPAQQAVEHKALFGAGTKVLDADLGIVEAIVSVTGIVDEVKDIITPGAYAKTIAVRLPKGVSHHAWEQPVAKALNVKELLPGDPELPTKTARGMPWPPEAGAVKVKVQFNLDTQRGREAYADVKFFEDEQEWSIGYNVPRGGARLDHKKGIRHIDTLDWYEFSPVLFGAMPLAGSVKSRYGGMVVGDEVKALPGSYEDITGKLEKAARGVLIPKDHSSDGSTGPMDPVGGWVSVQATFPDHIIVTRYTGEDRDEYSFPYTMTDGDVVLGSPTAVKITETVEPVAAAPEPATPDAGVPSPMVDGTPPVSEEDLAHKRKFDQGKRDAMAKEGAAMPDGSYPIANRDDLSNAIQAIGRAKDQDATKRHIIARARALDAIDALPADWEVTKDAGVDLSITDLIVAGVETKDLDDDAEAEAEVETKSVETLTARDLVENAILHSTV